MEDKNCQIEKSKASDLAKNYKEADEELSQELQDLIATLPIESDSFETQLCEYQGFSFPMELMQGVLKIQNHFQAHDSDILLATSPKSGTTWLKALIFAIINRNTHDPTSPILTTNPHVLVPFLEVLLGHENESNQSSFPSSSPSSPRIFATHIPYVSLSGSMKQSRCKIVYLCRNPKDQFGSYWHFMSKIRPETLGSRSIEHSFEEFCRGASLYGPFWDHMLGYYKDSLERSWKILFLRFEEFLHACSTLFIQLFLGLSIHIYLWCYVHG